MSIEIMLQGEIRSGRKAETCSRSEIWRGSCLLQVVFENISFHVRMSINDNSSLIQIDVVHVQQGKGLCVCGVKFRYLTKDPDLMKFLPIVVNTSMIFQVQAKGLVRLICDTIIVRFSSSVS
jgi:hypothetical protein